jgi:hypothetical protein
MHYERTPRRWPYLTCTSTNCVAMSSEQSLVLLKAIAEGFSNGPIPNPPVYRVRYGITQVTVEYAAIILREL